MLSSRCQRLRRVSRKYIWEMRPDILKVTQGEEDSRACSFYTFVASSTLQNCRCVLCPLNTGSRGDKKIVVTSATAFRGVLRAIYHARAPSSRNYCPSPGGSLAWKRVPSAALNNVTEWGRELKHTRTITSRPQKGSGSEIVVSFQ